MNFRCRHCAALIRASERFTKFLLPQPSGEVFMVTVHDTCLPKFNTLATSKAYSDSFHRLAAR